jgi:hypothetical protein
MVTDKKIITGTDMLAHYEMREYEDNHVAFKYTTQR